AIAYRDAGADCVYPMGLTEAVSIKRFVKELDFPINVMVRKGLPAVNELERLGVARVSFGPSASYAAMGLLKRASKEALEKGTYENLVEGVCLHDVIEFVFELCYRRFVGLVVSYNDDGVHVSRESVLFFVVFEQQPNC